MVLLVKQNLRKNSDSLLTIDLLRPGTIRNSYFYVIYFYSFTKINDASRMLSQGEFETKITE